MFNADAIKNVTLTTGGFPSRYGGRLSSVLEINMKEGNLNEWHGEGSVGIIASRLTVEGPLKKGTTSVMLSGRRTYIDALAAPIVALQTQGNSAATLYFYDLNGKINHKFSEKDRLYASAYLGQDNFGFSNKTSYLNNSSTFSGGLNWGNATAALRWNHIWNKKLFSNTTATYSYYQLNTPVSSSSTTNGNTSGFEVRYFSGITDWAGKIDFDYVPNPQHYIRFGAGGIYHTFKPGATNVKLTGTGSPGLDTTFGTQNIRSGEYALYAEDDYSVTKDFKANVGLHVSAFAVQNQSYYSAQPRVGLRYLLPNRVALKASFATMTQYVHLLTNEGIGLPTDLWVPTTAKVKPEQSWQAAFGAATTVAKDYELTAEVYYKGMQNVVSYQEGASFFGNTDWESKVTQGKGTAYGLELMFQKKAGNTTGWIGYTLAWSTRQFADINFGKAFPYKYDRRHDIEIVVIHKFNDRISLSGTWVYGTGNAVSLPLAKYASLVEYNQYGQQSAGTVSYYGEKNSFRLPAYHRLDISVEFHKKFKHWERTWTIGAYNAYSNPNVFFVYQGNNETTFAPEFKQVSLFPIVPSVSYNFKF